MTQRVPVAKSLSSGLALAFACSALGSAEQPAAAGFLRQVVGFGDAQLAAVEAGRVVTKPLATADKAEMAAFGAVRVGAEAGTFLKRLRDIEVFRRGDSVLQIGRFGNPPRLADVAELTLEDVDFEAARKCRPGSCDLKLARSAMERLCSEIRWSAPDARIQATALMRQMLVEYTAAYMAGGTAAMATYNDKEKPLEAPAEFRKLLAASPYLFEYAPEFHEYVEDYPKGRLADAHDLFYWAKDKFGPKPTTSVYHVTIWRDPKHAGRAVVSSKQIYASHYFRAGLDLTALVEAPAGQGGFYLMDLYRARVDPPTGLLSGVLLGKIRGGIEQGVAQGLRDAKARAEVR